MKTVNQYMADCTGALDDGDDTYEARSTKAAAMLWATAEVVAFYESPFSTCDEGYRDAVESLCSAALDAMRAVTSEWRAKQS